jgi:hypothetical protein
MSKRSSVKEEQRSQGIGRIVVLRRTTSRKNKRSNNIKKECRQGGAKRVVALRGAMLMKNERNNNVEVKLTRKRRISKVKEECY